ncbi:nucleotidyltransferase domain-containing protein [Candidatus Saccharibacteria bacterium]|nr:nucleotidyltransferase domain-containing protein [Candidatus Saccharibacteria bacterium]
MLTVNKIQDVVTKLGKKYGLASAYLFGSYAKNNATEESDVDIIIERGEVKTYDKYYHLHKELEAELGKSVDLLATDGVRPMFYELIKNERIPLYGA